MKKPDPLEDVGKLKKGEHAPSIFERAFEEAIGDLKPLGAADDPAREAWPELWRWLTQVMMPGNRYKEPATLILRVGPEGVSATLNDRALGYAIDAQCLHLADIFDAVEHACKTPTAARRSHNKDPRVRKRKNAN